MHSIARNPVRDAVTAASPAPRGKVGARTPARGEARDAAGTEPRSEGRISSLVDQLDGLLGLSPGQLDQLGEAALRERVELARRLQGIATVTAALSRGGVIRADGASSVTAWLAEQTGTSRRHAACEARLAADLDDMPDTRPGSRTGLDRVT